MNEELLQLIINENKKYLILVKWVDKLFSYLNKFYVVMNKVPTVADNAMNLFYDHAIKKNEELLISTICKQMNDIRNGELKSHALLSDMVHLVLKDKSKYVPIAKFTEQYYVAKLNAYKANKESLTKYIETAYSFTHIETDIICHSFPNELKMLILNSFYSGYFSNLQELLDDKNGLAEIITKNSPTTLQQLSEIIILSESIAIQFCKSYKKYLENEFKEFIANLELQHKNKQPLKSLITALINYVKYHHSMFKAYFSKSSQIKIAFLSSLTALLKLKLESYSMMQWLAVSINSIVSDPNISDEQFYESVDQLILLFECIESKDIFGKQYKLLLEDMFIYSDPDLSKLLCSRQKYIVGKMTTNSGISYTTELNSILNDIESSFNFTSLVNSESKEIAANVIVLPITHTKLKTTANLLSEATGNIASKILYEFTKINIGKKLNIQYDLSTFEVSYCINMKYYIIVCSQLQAYILMQFNYQTHLLPSQIEINTSSESADVIKALKPFIQNQILVQDGVALKLNSSFISPKSKFRIAFRDTESYMVSEKESTSLSRRLLNGQAAYY